MKKKELEIVRKYEKSIVRIWRMPGSAQRYVNRLFHGFESYDRNDCNTVSETNKGPK
jgi:hypothetical protein